MLDSLHFGPNDEWLRFLYSAMGRSTTTSTKNWGTGRPAEEVSVLVSGCWNEFARAAAMVLARAPKRRPH